MVQALSPLLEDYPALDLLAAPYLMEEFDSLLIEEFLDRMVPSNVMMAISSLGYEGRHTEPWFGVHYDLDVGPIDLANVEASSLSLPTRNPFLPESLSLVNGDEDIPLPVVDEPSAQIYVDTDLEFSVPRSVIHVSLRNPGGLMDAENAARARLYGTLVQDDLNSVAYPALLA